MNRRDYWIPNFEELLRHPGLTDLDADVHGYLARLRMSEKDEIRPRQKTIAECLGVSDESVRKSLRRLREIGLVTASPGERRDDGTKTSNLYWPLMPTEWTPTILGSTGTSVPVETGKPVPVAPSKRQKQKRQHPPATAGVDDLMDMKPPFGSVVSELRDLFSNATGRAYSFTKADTGILARMWEQAPGLPEIRRVFAAAGMRRATDPFWERNWSLKWVYGKYSELLNSSPPAGGEGLVDERIVRGLGAAWTGILTTLNLCGIGEPEARGHIRSVIQETGDQAELRLLRRAGAALNQANIREIASAAEPWRAVLGVLAAVGIGSLPAGGEPATGSGVDDLFG